jgi:hypothetical protein
MPVDPICPPQHNLHFNLISVENFKRNNSTFSEQKEYALHKVYDKLPADFRVNNDFDHKRICGICSI